MDEESYKSIRTSIVSVPCAFEKSIVAARVCCSRAIKNNIAEREVVRCGSAKHQIRCETWLQMLRQKSQFTLRLPAIINESTVLPHAKEMKVQVGGIGGLFVLLVAAGHKVAEEDDALLDVSLILQACTGYLEEFENLSFEEIIKSVANFRLR